MKYQTTQRAVKQGYNKIIYAGYCSLQHLLNYENPVAYTVRKEGWGADIYDFKGVAIVTGYAPFGNIRADWEICKNYDNAAKKILYEEHSLSYPEQKKRINRLIEAFVKEVSQ